MKRLDEGKVSLVDFLRSIKFAHHDKSKDCHENDTHFADFTQQTRRSKRSRAGNSNPIRSAN